MKYIKKYKLGLIGIAIGAVAYKLIFEKMAEKKADKNKEIENKA